MATGLGTAELIFYAQNEAGPGDAIMLMIPVRPLAIPDVTSTIGQFTTSSTTTLLWPENPCPTAPWRVELSRSIAGSMVNGLEYLTGYP
ncbi:MAG: hypothetical protein IPL78_23150 [Chloroflexi bacterium]|nr:hypothetical protein [Chloroflexota bacterium]